MDVPGAGEGVPDQLAKRIRAARWYPDKASGAPSLWFEDVAEVRSEGPPRSWLTIVSSRAAPDGLVVPISASTAQNDGESTLLDAAEDARLIAGLMVTIFKRGTLVGAHGRFVGRLTTFAASESDADVIDDSRRSSISVMPIGADASNSSLAVALGAARYVVKIVRRVRRGLHPQVEIGRFFALESPFSQAPPLVGWLEYIGGDGPAATVMIVERHLEGRSTAWDRLLGMVGSDWAGCLADARVLGRLTASMHAALGARPDIDAFAPHACSTEHANQLADRLVRHARLALTRIRRVAASAAPHLADRLTAVAARDVVLTDRLASIAFPPPTVTRIRVHGDYHLGQVLVMEHAKPGCDDAWAVIDFEGEPSRPLDERRERHPAAKDVAGMCRSFDYLLRVASREKKRAYDPCDLVSLEKAFLDAYREVSHGRSWWPDSRVEEGRLLDAWKLDKAIYELLYECDNRPDWIEVPLAAIEILAGTPCS